MAPMSPPFRAPAGSSSIWSRPYTLKLYRCVAPAGGQGPVYPIVPKSFLPCRADTGLVTSAVFGIPAGISPARGMFQINQGQNEQQDGWKGLTAMTATETAESPSMRILGDVSPPSQVCEGGNSRKSRRTTSLSMTAWCIVSSHNGSGDTRSPKAPLLSVHQNMWSLCLPV